MTPTTLGDPVDNPQGTQEKMLISHHIETRQEEQICMSRDWSIKEENRVKLKLDCLLMPLVVAGLFALQLDKGNLSNALTSTFVQDLGITSNNVNDGNQLQLAAIIIFEIPFNIILSKLGAPIWLTFEAFAWGLVATFQCFINNRSSFYATRFLLGMFEAGYLPGSMTILAEFYTRKEIAMRITILYIGNYLAQGVGSLIAAGVFNLAGAHGLAGWQWLFLIDGAFTIFVAFLFLFFLPGKPTNTQPLCSIKVFNFFNERERHIMSRRVVIDDPNKRVSLATIKIKEAATILTNYRLWGHCIINIIALTPKGGLQLYSPTIIKSLGFDTITANALASVSNYGVIILALIAAYISDKTRHRGLVCLVCGAYSLIFAGAQYSMTTNNEKWAKYAVFTLLNSGNAVAQGVNDAWMSSNARNAKERCIAMALCVIGSNLGGLSGQQLFQSQDAPKFTQGFVAVLCLYAASIVAVILQMLSYMWGNHQIKKQAGSGEGEAEISTEVAVTPTWKYEI